MAGVSPLHLDPARWVTRQMPWNLSFLPPVCPVASICESLHKVHKLPYCWEVPWGAYENVVDSATGGLSGQATCQGSGPAADTQGNKTRNCLSQNLFTPMIGKGHSNTLSPGMGCWLMIFFPSRLYNQSEYRGWIIQRGQAHGNVLEKL